jgi:dienelactone hydrolase
LLLRVRYSLYHLNTSTWRNGADAELSCVTETDEVFTTQLRHESEEILIKTGQLYQINLFGGVQHGFAVRGDLSKPLNKYAKEQAFVQAVAWFNYHVEL